MGLHRTIATIQYNTMSTAKTAIAVLADAEAKLRELVGQAAAQGDYDAAVKMATIAKDVAALAVGLDSVGPTSVGASAGPGPADPSRTQPADSSAAASGRRGRSERLGGAARSRRTPPKGEYPKFFRQGDHLVKVSWSKKDRDEYQHKAPRRVAELLAGAIAKRAANGRQFTSDDIFPLKDPQDGGEVPSYQAYAALAWFKTSGLVRPHGRRGYTAKNQGALQGMLPSAWERLAELPG